VDAGKVDVVESLLRTPEISYQTIIIRILPLTFTVPLPDNLAIEVPFWG